MKLPHHNRCDYVPINKRPDYSWPGGKRLAAHFAVNIEHFAFGRGETGMVPAAETPPPDHRNFCWKDYGLRVGVWRIFDLLDELKLPAHHLINTAVYDYAPEIFEKIRERGDEVVGHGRTNSERPGLGWEDDERRLILEVTETIARHEGKPPSGWMAPWMSQSHVTPDLLKAAGYGYLMDWPLDDQPIWLRTKAGPILSVPYPMEINDAPAMIQRRHSATEFTDMIIDQFEQLLKQSEQQPLVFGASLHAQIAGQPFRLRQTERALRYIAEHPRRDEVWFTRPSDIASHIRSLPVGTVPGSAPK
jgi:peptidoglycan/xylan/chitin deacetylase (PgdA/CDA1 family)